MQKQAVGDKDCQFFALSPCVGNGAPKLEDFADIQEASDSLQTKFRSME